MTARKWLVQRTNKSYISYLSKALSITPAASQVLINRGVKTPKDAEFFFRASVDDLCDPLSIGGVGQAVELIKRASTSGTRIFVHGDYDADGVTATAIMVGTLRRLGADVRYHIPNRFTDGYGFNPSGVRKAKEAGAGLIVTVDCGISSFEAVETAKREGIGVIVTDHHEPSLDPVSGIPVLPDALSVVDPKASNPEMECPSGAGIALKISQALLSGEHASFFDLAALGTLADSVSLMGENRIIAKEGLNSIREGRRAAVRALKDVSGLNARTIKAWTLCFTLVPRINAAGRLSDASGVVEFLLSDSESIAAETAALLEKNNVQRQKVEEGLLNEALAALAKLGDGTDTSAISLWGEGWHEGVIGIVAARIAERYGKPAFVFSVKDGLAKGSARGVPGLDIYSAISEVKDILIGFGGHKQAAGIKIREENLPAFRDKISEAVSRRAESYTPTLHLDADVGLNELDFGLLHELEMLEPFGPGNPEPLFGSKGLEVVSPRVVGGKHLKMRLKSGGRSMDAIWFEMGGFLEELNGLASVDAAYKAEMNEWEGGKSVQLNLKALRKTAIRT